MTRTEAIAAGKSTYWTGKPCKHGHTAERYVLNWTCVTCHAQKCAEYQPKWRAKNPEKQTEYAKKYSEKHAFSTKQWREANKDHCLQTQLNWNHRNSDRRNELNQEWRKQNRDAMNALKAKRRADILSRMPKWLSSDERWMIGQAYELAKLRTNLTNFDWHVDHVIPLRGRMVSGLHTPYNLQVIPAVANLQKGNRYVTDQPVMNKK